MASSRTSRRPAITIGKGEHGRLTKLAEAHASKYPDVSDELLQELERARVVDDALVPPDVVHMGSTVCFTSDLGEDRQVTLVFPGEADIAEGKISILTPIGVALIGLKTGQSIDWTARDGRLHRLTVDTVRAPVETGHLL
ncbi:nucleoside diphosphate kinase regulator protein (plasmid) [Rhizobium phaseoli]|uniref:Nucleoside diphosphate kinase regulator protein n=1 Tax=Rhizobium phaseoli TaxID=396 RepID=A0ABM6CHW1_9HYPH|nr:nucleoside diphosphate kinase regulator [Rhizobium phaseoli]ANL68607.1 nucleoside diphosphate kinase regulator protein [Rhizobium phaseoli]ANL81416.1 nucleoside diphosphate kinase regulator protein [Rhizobium phaseoli]ANL87903.1 nucleoside diphosphate kinase regulator protein [Rhizobium phaseoli]ANL94412.1 nucleoside diphosphate kinase regulator protein [Rhizobium phaseoli]RDJ03664.1 nucleoside diphosphate kinase regulator [Rhizobium phaseoli]